MRTIDMLDKECLGEYFEGVTQRLGHVDGAQNRLALANAIACSAEKHIARLQLASRRIKRAAALGDDVSLCAERETATALMYEAFDHLCMAVVLLDFDELGLTSSVDGTGLIGDAVLDLVRVLSSLERFAHHLVGFEHELHIRLDFSHPVDEKEGVTFDIHRHWQDYCGPSIDRSFREYFDRSRRAVLARLAQRPLYWSGQTVRAYLEKKKCFVLLMLLHRLETAVKTPKAA